MEKEKKGWIRERMKGSNKSGLSRMLVEEREMRVPHLSGLSRVLFRVALRSLEVSSLGTLLKIHDSSMLHPHK
jgi:hypothetical protein